MTPQTLMHHTRGSDEPLYLSGMETLFEQSFFSFGFTPLGGREDIFKTDEMCFLVPSCWCKNTFTLQTLLAWLAD